MPESIISPRVKTREINQSFIPPLPEQRTALVIGATEKGNYFVPQTVTLQNISSRIGVSNPRNLKDYTSFTAQNFLRGGSDSVKVLPVTAISGEDMGTSYVFTATVGTTEYEFLQLFPTADSDIDSVSVDITDNTLSNVTVTVTPTVKDPVAILENADLTDPQVLRNFYDKYKNPTSENNPVFVKAIVDVHEIATAHGEDDLDISSAEVTMTETASVSTLDYQKSSTPFILSQNGEQLFKLKSLTGSDLANRSIKVRITNIVKGSERNDDSPYGEFTIELYSYVSNNIINDPNRSRNEDETLLESFSVSFDPEADNYIERRIGNRKEEYDETTNSVQFDGVYANRSSYVRVVMSDQEFGSNALPWGFEQYSTLIDFFGGNAPLYNDPVGRIDGGINFDNQFVDFLHVEELSQFFTADPAQNYNLGDFSTLEESDRRFVLGMFGGTKGLPDNIVKNTGKEITTTNTFGFDFTTDGSGDLAYKRAIDIIADKEYIDFDVLFLAGLNAVDHEAIIEYALRTLEGRGDAILFFDAGGVDDTEQVMIDKIAEFDSTYGSAFAPWLLTGTNQLIPASSAFANAIAVNDRNYKPWYSLIGIERGQITGVSDVTKRYNMDLRDRLVDNNINPIAKYKGNILVFGTETLEQRDTLLSKYPIRRLLIESKRRISDIADFYIGRQYTDQIIASLTEEISEELSIIKDQNGLNDFRVEFDRDADLRDRGIVNGRIVLSPTTAIQGIVLTFKVTNTGVEFDF